MGNPLQEADPNNLLNYVKQLESRLAAVEQAFVVAENADEIFNEVGDIPHGDTAKLTRTGIELLNGAFTEVEAANIINDVGWYLSQLANTNGVSRQMRWGMRDNGTEAEGVVQYFTPGADITIDNYNFDSLDMTGWTEKEAAGIQQALGTLNTAFSVYCIAVIGNDIYVGGNGFTTSSVWKYTATTGSWAAYGTLSTGFLARAFAVIGNDIYVGGNTFTTSSVWKSASGGAWAAYGTLSAAFSVKCLAVIGNDIYAGGQGFTTSSVWKSASGGAWAAYGTLSAAFSVQSLAVVGSDIYAGGTSFTTSSVWKSASGGAWAAYGTLSAAFSVNSLAVIGSDIYAGGQSFTTSSVWKSASGGAWAAYGTLSTTFSVQSLAVIGNDIYAGGQSITTSSVWKSGSGGAWVAYALTNTVFVVISLAVIGNNIYAGGQSFTTSSVWIFTITGWDASQGYASITNINLIPQPEIEMATRFAVTATDRLEIKGSTLGTITGGTLVFTIGVRFYTASSGGSLVSTVTAFTRTLTADGALQEGFGYVTVPATATHAVIFGKFSNTAGVSTTGGFDRFRAKVVNVLRELVFKDNGIYQVKDSQSTDIVTKGYAPIAYPIGFSGQGVTTNLNLAANGGALLTPIAVTAPMMLESVTARNMNATGVRTWNWFLYIQDTNLGVSAENVLRLVASGTAAETFTATAASARTINASGEPVTLPEGIYWLLIQNQHATNTYGLGIEAVTSPIGAAISRAQTKTLTNPAGATLDAVSATWTKQNEAPLAVLRGQVFGESAAY